MALTAAATSMLWEKFASIIGLNNEAMISISPVKEFLSMRSHFHHCKLHLLKFLMCPKQLYIVDKFSIVPIYHYMYVFKESLKKIFF